MKINKNQYETIETLLAGWLAGWQELLRKKTSIEQEKDGIAENSTQPQHCSSTAVAMQ